MKSCHILGLALAFALLGPLPFAGAGPLPVGDLPTTARAPDGAFISWREHLIDERTEEGPLTGGDGLVMGDLDGDGLEDIVSVHESDTTYDGVPDGYVRAAFGTREPGVYFNVTLARGAEAGAPEDAAIGDVNGDGHHDVVTAAELAHLLYLQNPGTDVRTRRWERLIPPQTQGRGSFIRVFLGDFDGDGRPEIATANKGAQSPRGETAAPTAISVFKITGDPLRAESWQEHVLGRYVIPQNAEPVDLDGDGDLDIIGGLRREERLVFFENVGTGTIAFRERRIEIAGARAGGFNLGFADLDGDGRLDIIAKVGSGLGWIAQPADLARPWTPHAIGSFAPDSMTGFGLADIDGDGDLDVMAGSYSGGERAADAAVTAEGRLGRIGWFENPGDPAKAWTRHDVSRRKRGMFDKFIARDVDGDGDADFLGTRGNSNPYDGVFWLEQLRSAEPRPAFTRARTEDSAEMPLPEGG